MEVRVSNVEKVMLKREERSLLVVTTQTIISIRTENTVCENPTRSVKESGGD